MRRLLLLTAALTLGLAGITASTAAMATTTHQAHPVTSATTTQPTAHTSHHPSKTGSAIDSCSVRTGDFTEYATNCGNPHAYVCTVGHERNFSYIPSFVSNGCVTRVLIYTGTGETGHHICIGPATATGTLHTSYRSFRVGSATSC
jgi:hypothetical protein